jgi:hypothetical membrane protein
MEMSKEIRLGGARRRAWAASAGIAAPVIFAFVVAIASLLRPGFSQVFNYISELGIGPYAAIQNVNFIATGLLIVFLASGIGSNSARRSARAAPLALALGGIGTALAGLTLSLIGPFPESVMYEAHSAVAILSFAAFMAAELLSWQALTGAEGASSRNYRRFSLLCGLLSVLTLLLFFGTMFSEYKGLTERIFVAFPMTWIGATGLRLRALADKGALAI